MVSIWSEYGLEDSKNFKSLESNELRRFSQLNLQNQIEIENLQNRTELNQIFRMIWYGDSDLIEHMGLE